MATGVQTNISILRNRLLTHLQNYSQALPETKQKWQNQIESLLGNSDTVESLANKLGNAGLSPTNGTFSASQLKAGTILLYKHNAEAEKGLVGIITKSPQDENSKATLALFPQTGSLQMAQLTPTQIGKINENVSGLEGLELVKAVGLGEMLEGGEYIISIY
ncbi:MAG: hypothetical protein ACKVTZ_10985 [Bacteroidia bacterium]